MRKGLMRLWSHSVFGILNNDTNVLYSLTFLVSRNRPPIHRQCQTSIGNYTSIIRNLMNADEELMNESVEMVSVSMLQDHKWVFVEEIDISEVWAVAHIL